MNIKSLILIAVLSFPCAAALCQSAGSPVRAPVYTDDGRLVLPEDYRTWVYLSSGFDMSYNPAMRMGHHMFDNVFVEPGAYKAFIETGTVAG